MADTYLVDELAAQNIVSKTVAAPTIIRGSADASKFPGVVTGMLPDAPARVANGTALQGFLDWCASNGKWAEFPPERYEYSASATQNSRNTGLHMKSGMGIIGGGDRPGDGTRFVQYASNHPALTIGDVSNTVSNLIEGGQFTGFCVGHGSSQTGQASADGLLLGRIWRSTFDQIYVSPTLDGTNHAYCGMRIGLGLNQFFFSNRIGTLVSKSGQAHLFRMDSNGTGCEWANLYFGGVSTAGGAGTFGARLALSAEPVFINTPEFGHAGQFNIEWCSSSGQTAALRADNCDVLDIACLHIEGNQLNNFDGRMMIATASRVNIGSVKMLDNWIAAVNATGTPSLLRVYGNSNVSIDQFYARWNGSGYNAEAVASMAFQLYRDDSTIVGRKPLIGIGDFLASGNTGALSIDANTAGTAPGSSGAISSFQSYQFNKDRSRTVGATIQMGNSNLTVYGVHRLAKVAASVALTANRTLTLSDKLAASGAGSTSTRMAGDIIEVHRTGAGAFDLIVSDQAAAVLFTFTGAASAGTVKSFEWSGTAWTAL